MASDDALEMAGLDGLQAQLAGAAGTLVRAAGVALRGEGELIMTAAKKLTPVETGALRASGHVTGPEGPEQTVTLAFGGPAAPYAVFVHENMGARHEPPHGTGGQAKFLESAVLEAAPDLSKKVADRMGRSGA